MVSISCCVESDVKPQINKQNQYRVLHRILGVQQLLYKIKLSNTENCQLCNEHSETILHLFSDILDKYKLKHAITS